mmetsp:Transcript_13996/g.19663  ORF Transcript_13996/g.19663 Transcript_13996/m.19663 type:complete len:640 (+) Transcript_13996:143-2062(+)
MAPNSEDETRPTAEAEEDDDEKGKKDNPAPLLPRKDIPLKNIKDVADTDVLCGRGGAALRHPGNQTYRRLVQLNKALYITCLKAEKLKISKSIVAAIREQNGRFLEKDKKGLWYDIGDKKAMEKTSQALREGQPKLRQKIVELGGGAAGAAALLEHQFSNTNAAPNGIYPASQNHNGYGSTGPMGLEHGSAAAAGGGNYHVPGEITGSSGALNLARNSQSLDSRSNGVPIPNHPGAFRAHDDKSMMHRLSRQEEQKEEQRYPSSPSRAHQQHQHQLPSAPSFTPSLTQRGSAAAQALGVDETTLSAMSSYSNYGVSETPVMTIDQAHAHLMAQYNTQPRPAPSQHPHHHHDEQHTSHLAHAGGSGVGATVDYHNNNNHGNRSHPTQNRHSNSMTSYRRRTEEKTYEDGDDDRESRPVPDVQGTKSSQSIKMERRRMLDRTEFNAQPNHLQHPGHQESIQQQHHHHHPTSSQPHQQDRQHHAQSHQQHQNHQSMHNHLNHPGAPALDDMPDIHFVAESDTKSYMSNMSSSASGDNHYQTDDEDEVKVDPNRRAGADVASIISGFSKMSTNSTGTDEGSIFSDLSRKIGNVSTRSLLSDLSGMEDSDSEFSDDMDDHNHYSSSRRERQTATPTSIGSMDYD